MDRPARPVFCGCRRAAASLRRSFRLVAQAVARLPAFGARPAAEPAAAVNRRSLEIPPRLGAAVDSMSSPRKDFSMPHRLAVPLSILLGVMPERAW